MGDVDLAVISSGVGYHNPDLEWTKDRETIAVNVLGFCAMANVMMRHFLTHGKGHLVGISSIAALRGSGSYSASKAFVSNYMEGLRHQMFKEQGAITITDISPASLIPLWQKAEPFGWPRPNKPQK